MVNIDSLTQALTNNRKQTRANEFTFALKLLTYHHPTYPGPSHQFYGPRLKPQGRISPLLVKALPFFSVYPE